MNRLVERGHAKKVSMKKKRKKRKESWGAWGLNSFLVGVDRAVRGEVFGRIEYGLSLFWKFVHEFRGIR